MYLLDTHALIWFLTIDERLSKKAMEAICSRVPVFASVATFWEIAIKQCLNKIDIMDSMEQLEKSCGEQHIVLLPIELHHIERIKTLPFFHNDPFDRLLIAQAIENDLTLITKDTKIPQYEVKTLW